MLPVLGAPLLSSDYFWLSLKCVGGSLEFLCPDRNKFETGATFLEQDSSWKMLEDVGKDFKWQILNVCFRFQCWRQQVFFSVEVDVSICQRFVVNSFGTIYKVP